MLRLAVLLWLALCGASQAQPVQSFTQLTIPINISTATTTQLVAGRAGLSIYVSAVLVIAGGPGNFQFVSGTGVNCGTGQANLTGPIPLTAQAGFVYGVGAGAVLVAPQGASLCAVTSAASAMAGSLGYAQF